METRNATITGMSLSNEDHGCLSSFVSLDYGDSGCQGFGGYVLYSPKFKDTQGNFAGHFIWRVLECAGVTEWKNLIGKTVRVKSTHSSVEAIGHITKDIWFYPEKEFKEMKE